MAKSKIKFLHKPNCTTCRKAEKAFLGGRRKAELEVRDLGKKTVCPSRSWTS